MSEPSLKALYNSKITSTQKVTRTGNWSNKGGKGFHDGTVVTTNHGKYLVHNTPDHHQPVITPASNMSSKWKSSGDSKTHPNYTVAQAMKREHNHGSWSITNNCTHTADRVHNNRDCIVL
eukprot:716067_1